MISVMIFSTFYKTYQIQSNVKSIKYSTKTEGRKSTLLLNLLLKKIESAKRVKYNISN